MAARQLSIPSAARADLVVAWLRANLPRPGPIGIMHGDYSLYNVMFAHESRTMARLA